MNSDPAIKGCGSPHTTLAVIRGNSGSGKSSLAKAIRHHAGRDCALVEQDYLRRIILWEKERADGLAAQFIGHTVRYLLDQGRDVVLEGILWSGRYGDMITSLVADHRGHSSVFYLDVSLGETLRRHQLRPQATEFTADDMRGWYNPHDVLGLAREYVIAEDSSFDDSLALIAARSWPGLALVQRVGVAGQAAP